MTRKERAFLEAAKAYYFHTLRISRETPHQHLKRYKALFGHCPVLFNGHKAAYELWGKRK